MDKNLEVLLKQLLVFERSSGGGAEGAHCDEQDIAALLDGTVSGDELRRLQRHITSCPECAGALSLAVAQDFRGTDIEPGVASFQRVRSAVIRALRSLVMRVNVALSAKRLELRQTYGDVIKGSEIMPLGVYRARFGVPNEETVTVVKETPLGVVTITLVTGGHKSVNIAVNCSDRATKKNCSDIRFSLVQGDRELESRVAPHGSCSFERVCAGDYTVDIISENGTMSSVELHIEA